MDFENRFKVCGVFFLKELSREGDDGMESMGEVERMDTEGGLEESDLMSWGVTNEVTGQESKSNEV